MPEEYEEGTYLHEFTEAALEDRSARVAAVGTGVAASSILISVIVGGLALLISLAVFPIGICIGIPLFVLAIYLIDGVGAVAGNAVGPPIFLRGECPYCGHIKEAKPKEGDKVSCGKCFHTIVIRGNQYHIPGSNLKKFRKKILAPTIDTDQPLPPT